MHTHDYFIEQYSMHFKHLEDALAKMMELKRLNPRDNFFLNPVSEEISTVWDKKGFVVSQNFWCSNVPNIVLSIDDIADISDTLLKEFTDEGSYITEMAERIYREFDVNPEIGWELIWVGDTSDIEICLYRFFEMDRGESCL